MSGETRTNKFWDCSASVSSNTGEIVLIGLISEPVIIPVQTNSTSLITNFIRKMTQVERRRSNVSDILPRNSIRILT